MPLKDFMAVAKSMDGTTKKTAVDAEIEVSVRDYKMPHIAHHAKYPAEIFLLLYVDYGDAASATHATHDEISVVRSEYRAAKGISAATVTVNGTVQRIVEFELFVNHEHHLMMPLFRLFR